MKQMNSVKAILMGSIFLVTQAFAQQDPQYTMYMWNIMSVNPGYAGSADLLTATALSRHQWTGLAGAPTTQSLVLHSPLPNEKLAVGLSFVHDEVGPVKTNLIYGDFAYRIKTTENARLSLGLQAGVNLFQANLTDLQNVDANDPLFSQNVSSELTPNFGFGAFYFSHKGYVGLSAPKLIENTQAEVQNAQETANAIKERRHYFLVAGYVFTLSEDVHFRPSLMTKVVEGSPVSFDLSANFLFVEKLWLGVAYRHEDAVSGIISYQITDQFRAGYAHDFTLSELRDQHSGTHEFMLSYDLRVNRERTLSPRFF